ncbi:MAG TPA: type II secretion system F family protein [Kiritimatiellia bacterium]|nr:type II secretion system F family protein [Kiritimatiellia bacterium]
MARFSYTARSMNGERASGTIEAADKRAALLQLERQGLTPISVKDATGAAPTAAKTGAGKSEKKKKAPRFVLKLNARPRMNLRETLMFTRELSDLIASGMTLGSALHTLSQRHTGKGQDQIVVALRDEIIRGTSLSDALALWPETFSSLYVNMVRTGEASGKLADALERVGVHYERVQAAREKVSMALVYPGFVLSVGLLTMVFTMIFVVPRFSTIFMELGSTLPLPTRILIGTSSLLLNWGWLILIVIGLIIFFIRRHIATPEGRLQWHAFQLRVPVFKRIVTANAYAQFARTLGALLHNGVPVLQALGIVQDSMGNQIIAEQIREARERVTDGSTISGPLAAGKVFPPLLTDMLAVGEQSGDMPGALGHIARRYDDELDRNVKVFTTILEPLMIVLMAVLVGFVAISMLLAVFDLTSGLNIK